MEMRTEKKKRNVLEGHTEEKERRAGTCERERGEREERRGRERENKSQEVRKNGDKEINGTAKKSPFQSISKK